MRTTFELFGKERQSRRYWTLRPQIRVFVFGSVYINSTPERYLKFASDIDALRKLPSYLALQKFSDPPEISDLTGFTMDEEDFKELKNCRRAIARCNCRPKRWKSFSTP